jgi:hypothetical protein
MMQTKDEPASLVPWVIVAVLAYMLWSKPAPEPGPTPPPGPKIVTVEEAARNLITKTQSGYKSVFNSVAKRVEDGEIKTEEQLNVTLKKELSDVRESASKDLDMSFNVNIPTDFSGQGGPVATFLKRVANGF